MLKTIETIPLDGGRLCFDFINTVHSWNTEERVDFLQDYGDFLAWCHRLSVPIPPKITRSRERETGGTGTALTRIIKVRDILYKTFASIAQHSKPDEQVEKAFNKYLSSALASIRLQFQSGKVSVILDAEKDPPIGPLLHVLKSCYDVITMDDIKRTSNNAPTAAGSFYDSTKNNRRQWCNPFDMRKTWTNRKGIIGEKKRRMARDKGLPVLDLNEKPEHVVSASYLTLLYCASVTFSIQSTTFPFKFSWIAICVIAVVGITRANVFRRAQTKPRPPAGSLLLVHLPAAPNQTRLSRPASVPADGYARLCVRLVRKSPKHRRHEPIHLPEIRDRWPSP